jgi:hypothetical protein
MLGFPERNELTDGDDNFGERKRVDEYSLKESREERRNERVGKKGCFFFV